MDRLRLAPSIALCLAALGLATPSGPVAAAPLIIAPSEIAPTIDAFFDEWAGRPLSLFDSAVQGKRDGSGDLGGTWQVAFDESRIYLAAQVVDDKFQPGGADQGDRLFFVFRADDGPTRTVQVLLNTLEVRPPTVQIDGKPCPGCKTAGTMRVDGWAVEVSIPSLQLPLAGAGTVRSAGLVHDADADAGTVEGVVSSAPVDGSLAPTRKNLRLEALAALDEGRQIYQADRKPLGLPKRTLHGDVFGDSFPEEVLVTDDDVVLIGKDLPERAAYLYFTHGWREDPEVTRAEFAELDGVPGDELIVEHTEWSVLHEVRVGIVEVYGMHEGYWKRRFAHKVHVEFVGKGSATAPFEVLRARDGKAHRLQIGVAVPDGLERKDDYRADPSNFYAPPPPMPWNRKKPLVFRLEGERWR